MVMYIRSLAMAVAARAIGIPGVRIHIARFVVDNRCRWTYLIVAELIVCNLDAVRGARSCWNAHPWKIQSSYRKA